MKRVLVVDDDDIILEVAQMSLEAVAGWDVITASSGAEAVTTARAEVPDAIVMDVMMPDVDGPATLERLRPILGPGVPVVFLTAKVQPADIERLRGLGATGVLAKPFDPMRLPGELADVLAGS